MRPRTLPARVVVVFLAALVALLSSGCPGPDGEPQGGDEGTSKVENPDRLVTLSGTIQLEDYETFGSNEHASGSFNKTVFVGDAQPQVLENVPPPSICAGDEIWAALDIKVTRINAAGDISVNVDGRLYEGTTCNTSDLDGSYSTAFTVPANTTIQKSFTMWNTSEDEPEDRATITLTVYNAQAP